MRPGIKWFLTSLLVWSGVIKSQVPPQTSADELFDRLTKKETASGLLSLVSIAATPGIRGIDFTVDDEFTGTDIEYSKSNLAVAKNFGNIELGSAKFRIYTTLGFGALNQKKAFPITGFEGQPLLLDIDRDLNSSWLGLGLNFELPRHLRFKSYVTAAYSRFETQTTIFGEGADPNDLTPVQRAAFLDTKANAWTVTPTLNLKYDRWLQSGRLELEGVYSYS